MPIQTRLLTADEFLEWPDEPGCCRELIRGVGMNRPLAGALHGEIVAEIGRLIVNHVDTRRLGVAYAAGTGCIVERDPDTVRAADVAFVVSARLALITNEEKHIPFAPDLAVEVLSPHDRDHEVEEKVQLWLATGSQLVWVVDPESRTVVVHRRGAEPVTLSEADEIDAVDVIPGFRCRVSDFFA